MYKCWWRCAYQAYSVCRPDKVLAPPSGTFQKRTFMSSSVRCSASRWLPYLLVAPQLVITVIFFIWPAGEALWYSLQSVDPFGFSSQFVGLENFVALFHDSYYLDAFWTTIKFSALVTFSGLLVSLFFAAPWITWCAAAVFIRR
ncbi:hypothetical protein JRY29_11240 [Salmonella enterica subsp. enterica serovar Kentucky]|nr:hypothetical protein JRY29_11240 [Salmonella enterica subsp. enterica serovar Kentucky]